MTSLISTCRGNSSEHKGYVSRDDDVNCWSEYSGVDSPGEETQET